MELLCDAKICRLCGEKNAIGYELFSVEESQTSSQLSGLINHYLPMKVKNDGKFPRWICPGCNIQVEATVEFFDLIIRGQEKLRELQREEHRKQNVQDAEEEADFPEDSGLFPTQHTLTMQVQGVKNLQKKRGRPPRPSADILEAKRLKAEAEYLEEQRRKKAQEFKEQEEIDGRRKRRIRVPERYRSVVQGKELEKVYVSEGVIDKTDISDTEEDVAIIENTTEGDDARGSQIIGHLKSADGAVLSDLVVTQRTEFHRKGPVARIKMRFVCDVCNKAFSQEMRFLTHRATHQNVRFECTQCTQEFLKRELLKEHQETSGHTGQGIVESIEISTDEQKDGQDSNAIDAARALYDLQHDSIIPPRGSESAGANEMTQIAEIADNFMNIPELEGTFGSDDGVPDLVAYMEKSSTDAETQATFAVTKRFICSLCEMAFTHIHELRCHMESHRTPQNFFCDVCQKKFTDPSVVALHKETEHCSARRFACNRCDKHFMLKHQLQRHQNVHIIVRPFECSVCGKRFKTRPQLQCHATCHSQEKRYECDVCGQRFFYSGSLRHHAKNHRENAEKKYECEKCGRKFKTDVSFRKHQDIHHGAVVEEIAANPPVDALPALDFAPLDDNQSQTYLVILDNPNFDPVGGFLLPTAEEVPKEASQELSSNLIKINPIDIEGSTTIFSWTPQKRQQNVQNPDEDTILPSLLPISDISPTKEGGKDFKINSKN